ncbi:serine hydrolase [Paenibacillus elgii]|uniref:serine hydrolase domain-containing protein n=1 Tax=Paenibacillus elgii TaxID=189691 RepID=UPI002D7C78CE|nr:serine hydrolase [Paenibacillus elgii]
MTGNWSGFEAYAKAMMEKEAIPGAAVAVSLRGETVYQQGFGVRNMETGDPVTSDTVFGIASVTKSFTALAIMQLAEEGKLSLDDPVTKHLPEFKLRTSGGMRSEGIRVRHLLSHTAGVPPMRRREELRRFAEHLDYLANEEIELLGAPGDYFSYCNDTFLLLGAIVERLTGRPFRAAITERILEPLQMRRSTFSLDELAAWDNVSVPYVKRGGTQTLDEVPWPKLGNYEAGGGIRSTVRDLLKYGQLYVGDVPTSNGRPVARSESLRQIREPIHRIGRNAFYGCALRVTPDYSGVTLVEHGGGQPGVSSYFGFVPERGLVAAVLTNVANVPANELWLAAVNTALGFPLEQRSSVEPTYEASPEELRRLAGAYRSSEGGSVDIVLDGNSPFAEIDGKAFALRASDDRTLVITDSGYPIRFFFKDEPQAWAAFYGSRMLRRVNE